MTSPPGVSVSALLSWAGSDRWEATGETQQGGYDEKIVCEMIMLP